MSQMRKEKFAGLDVVLTGGSDGQGGGNGPLCVLLHGFGAPGTDLVPLARMLNVPQDLRFAFPAAPLSLAEETDEDGGGGDFGFAEARAWWLIDMNKIQRALYTGGWREISREEPVGLTAAREQLNQALDELQAKLNVPTGQLVLGGFSQGAMLSMDLALRGSRPLAGLVLWSGTIIAENIWLQSLKNRRGLPILQSHGQQDPILPFPVALSLRDHLLEAGLPTEFLSFHGGHEIPLPVLQATSRFLTKALAT